MSVKNSHKNKAIRRTERAERKAYWERLKALALAEEKISMVPGEEDEASDLVLPASQS